MLLYDLPYRPRPEIPDSVSAPDMTIPSDSIESKPFISHQLEKQDTTQLPADTTTTIPIIEQSDTTIRHTQLPEQVPAFPANDTLVPEQQPIPVISDTIRQAAGDSSYLLSTDTATVPEQSFPDIQAQTRTDSILRADESTQKLSEKVADDTTTTIQEKLSRDDTIVMTAKPGNIEQTDTVSRYRYNTRSRDNVLIDRFDPNCNRYDSSPTSSPGRIYSDCRDTGRSAESPTP